MGYPEMYVSRPISELFDTLLCEGHEKFNLVGASWKAFLPRKYYSFAGAYNGFSNGYRFMRIPTCEVKLKMAPPLTSTQPSFFTSDEYGKHLVGNAFSVPVVEALLRPLQLVFARRNYVGYDYRYAWEEAQH